MKTFNQELTDMAWEGFNAMPSPIANDVFPTFRTVQVGTPVTSFTKSSPEGVAGSVALFLGSKLNIAFTIAFVAKMRSTDWQGSTKRLDYLLTIGRQSADTMLDLGANLNGSTIIDHLINSPVEKEFDEVDEDTGEPFKSTRLVDDFKFLTKDVLWGERKMIEIHQVMRVFEVDDGLMIEGAQDVSVLAGRGRLVEIN